MADTYVSGDGGWRNSSASQYNGSNEQWNSTATPNHQRPVGQHSDEPAQVNALASSTNTKAFGKAQEAMLDDLDKLYACNLQDFNIDLPQIVVVGDQSCGKSSVLEAITGLDFPQNSQKCTRFPTLVRLRHAPQESCTVKIIPGTNHTQAEKDSLSRFSGTRNDLKEFGNLVRKASDKICPQGYSHWSAGDKLWVESAGPEMCHLAFVDLPGFIQTDAQEQSLDDMNNILELGRTFMNQEGTVILAVVSAQNDLSNQSVLKEAKAANKTLDRIMGIITKPDLAKSVDMEGKYIVLASGNDPRNRFPLGWHVLRNRGPHELPESHKRRNELEDEFFANPEHSNWRSLGEKNIGVAALRIKLGDALSRLTRDRIPIVDEKIRKQLNECEDRLFRLGESKETAQQMRQDFEQRCETCSKFTLAAAEGHYDQISGPLLKYDFFCEDSRRLRARVETTHEDFGAAMYVFGPEVHINEDENSSFYTMETSPSYHMHIPKRVSRAKYTATVVDPLLKNNPSRAPNSQRDPELIYDLFRRFSHRWDQITDIHISTVNETCKGFCRELVTKFWPDHTQSAFWELFLEPQLRKRLEAAQDEAAKLKRDRLRHIKLQDFDHLDRIRNWEHKSGTEDENSPAIVDFRSTKSEEFLETMLALYKVSTFFQTTNSSVSSSQNVIAQNVFIHEQCNLSSYRTTLARWS